MHAHRFIHVSSELYHPLSIFEPCTITQITCRGHNFVCIISFSSLEQLRQLSSTMARSNGHTIVSVNKHFVTYDPHLPPPLGAKVSEA